MPSMKDAQTPPPNIKDMTKVSSAETHRPPAPAPQSERTGLNQLAIGPVPSILGTVYDTVRQWIRPGSPQFRTFPLPVKANPQITSIVKSVIETSVTTSGAVPGSTPSGTFLPLAGGTLTGPLVIAPAVAPLAINSQSTSSSQFAGNVSVSAVISGFSLVVTSPSATAAITLHPPDPSGQVEIGGRDVSNVLWLWQIQNGGAAFFPSVEATNGYSIGGAAPTGHILRGNGVRYVDANLSDGSITITTPTWTPFTVAGLPGALAGQYAYASNGRKIGEGVGAGTGVPVYFSNGSWRVFSTDLAVAS